MKKISINDKDIIATLGEWARKSYIKAINKPDPDKWVAEAIGYPDGQIVLHDLSEYDEKMDKDVYEGKAYYVLSVKIDEESDADTESLYNDNEIINTINYYRDWMKYGCDASHSMEVLQFEVEAYQDYGERPVITIGEISNDCRYELIARSFAEIIKQLTPYANKDRVKELSNIITKMMNDMLEGDIIIAPEIKWNNIKEKED